MLIFSRAIISTDWSPAVRWWRWWLSGDGLGFHISDLWVSDYKMRGTAELSSAMPCINRLGWTNQPSWCLLTCWLLTQYLNNALWSSYVTQTTDRGSSGSHCSRWPPRRRGWLESGWLSTSASPSSSWSSLPAVTQLAVITPPGPSIQHTELWFPTNRRSMQHQSATPHSGDTRRMWRGRGPGSASRHCAIISGYTITNTNSR